jgi:hypothetical protein
MIRQQVRNAFGEPDDFFANSTVHDASIWKYEVLEFHFEEGADGPLNLIYMDTGDAVFVSIPGLARLKYQ